MDVEEQMNTSIFLNSYDVQLKQILGYIIIIQDLDLA